MSAISARRRAGSVSFHISKYRSTVRVTSVVGVVMAPRSRAARRRVDYVAGNAAGGYPRGEGGRRYRELRWPLREVGSLLEAGGFHPGRRAHTHLLALAAGNGIGRARVDEVLDMVGLADVADRRAGRLSLGMAQRLGIAAALL